MSSVVADVANPTGDSSQLTRNEAAPSLGLQELPDKLEQLEEKVPDQSFPASASRRPTHIFDAAAVPTDPLALSGQSHNVSHR